MKTTFHNQTTYQLNTGGGCMLYFRYTNRINKVGQRIGYYWDNHSGCPPRFVSVVKYAGSFEIGEGNKVYISEMTVKN